MTASTNADARAGRPGDVFTADFQTAGRGRLDHRWLSSRGMNLMFSAVFDATGRPPAEVATFPLVAGLAVAQTVASILRESGADADNVRVKWPNDVMARSRKLCGILCERNGECVIAGIGVNVNQTVFPPEIAHRATSLALLAESSSRTGSHKTFPLDGVLSRLLEDLYTLHSRWAGEGFAALHGELSALDFLAGREVSVCQTDGDARPVSGICGGIMQDGALLVGGVRIYAGEVSVTPLEQ